MAKKMLIVLVCLIVGSCLYLQHPKFGTLPAGDRLAIVQRSPNYIDGKFQNLIPTTIVVDESSWWEELREDLWGHGERLTPTTAIPTTKTDLKTLERSADVVIWLGHSSYFMQLGGKRILIDPVFSAYASPVSFVNQAFPGTNPYISDDMPDIDYLLISHDHWDHLDYPSIIGLKPKIKNVVCGLGVGSYFEQWGFAATTIYEADWFTKLQFDDDFIIHVLPARHFSGRLFSENKTLWVGFAVISPERSVFYSGDSGYGSHFKTIGQMFKGFDLAILENGQYDERWPNVHMLPEEVVKAAEDLATKALLPAHAGKFAMAAHPWDEPFKRITAASKNKQFHLLTPMIGELVEVKPQQQIFSPWWESAK